MKRIARVALSVTIFASSVATARPTADISSPRRLVVEKVILTEGENEVCVADTANRPDLIPYFTKASTQNSNVTVNLRGCEDSEIAAIQQIASVSVKKADVAALPAIVIGTLAICAVTGALGAFGGATETPFIGGVAMTTPPLMMAKGAWWKGPKIAVALSAGILACGAAGYYGAKGVRYLLGYSSEADQ